MPPFSVLVPKKIGGKEKVHLTQGIFLGKNNTPDTHATPQENIKKHKKTASELGNPSHASTACFIGKDFWIWLRSSLQQVKMVQCQDGYTGAVDGRRPAPVDIENIPRFIGFRM